MPAKIDTKIVEELKNQESYLAKKLECFIKYLAMLKAHSTVKYATIEKPEDQSEELSWFDKLVQTSSKIEKLNKKSSNE